MRISDWSSDVCSSDLETEVPVWVRFAGAEDYGMAVIATFMVRSPDGRTVPLLSMVDVSINPAATEVERTNRQTTLTIKASLAKDTTRTDERKEMEDAITAVDNGRGAGRGRVGK